MSPSTNERKPLFNVQIAAQSNAVMIKGSIQKRQVVKAVQHKGTAATGFFSPWHTPRQKEISMRQKFCRYTRAGNFSQPPLLPHLTALLSQQTLSRSGWLPLLAPPHQQEAALGLCPAVAVQPVALVC